jgi:glycerophosphoryl diester phosphodiesterase
MLEQVTTTTATTNWFKPLLGTIYKFNTFTDTENYQLFFYLGAVAFCGLSYICQILLDKPCEGILPRRMSEGRIFPVVLRLFHHLLLYFIYFSLVAPTRILPLEVLITSVTLVSWIFLGNKCILTILENRLCNYPKTRVFRDLTFYISRKMDTYFSKIRIYVFTGVIAILVLRLYVNYRNQRIDIQGHRGARGNYPENSLAAFAFALDHGITSLELDLHMSRDGVLVIYHDNVLNTAICKKEGEGGVTGGNHTAIREMSLQELKQYDCGSGVNPDFPQQVVSKQSILTFDELLTFLHTKYALVPWRLNVEIKTTRETDSDEYVRTFAKKLVEGFETQGLVSSSIIQSFDLRALQVVRAMNRRIQTSYNVEGLQGKGPEQFDELLKVCSDNRIDYFSPDVNGLSSEIVQKFHQKGIRVLPWTVNSLEEMERMVSWQVDGIITDYPVKMKEYLVTH